MFLVVMMVGLLVLLVVMVIISLLYSTTSLIGDFTVKMKTDLLQLMLRSCTTKER